MDECLTQLQRSERCVRRAVRLMGVLTALAIAGLCYAAVFLGDYPQSIPVLATQFLTRISCALGLASVVCLLTFVGLAALYRRELDQRRDECRRLAIKLLESRLGKPQPAPLVNRDDAASALAPP